MLIRIYPAKFQYFDPVFLQESHSFVLVRNWCDKHTLNTKTIANKGDLIKYEIRYRWLNELFISQYSFIDLNISRIPELFRYVNPCIFIWFHGTLVRNWCGVWEVDIWKRVHHDRLVGPYPTE